VSRPRQHVVKQGEHLAKIADAHGVAPDLIWDHPANRQLRELDRSPGVLAPGDVLTIPAPPTAPLALRARTHNAFEANVARVSVRVQLQGDDGPLANAPYVLEGVGALKEGRTDGEGYLEEQVPADVERLRVVLTEHHQVIPLRVGHLDPVSTESGVSQRLKHLGLVGEGDPREDAVREGVAAFQHRAGLDPSGVVDEATREALRRAHGS